jgi:hypothetical protein
LWLEPLQRGQTPVLGFGDVRQRHMQPKGCESKQHTNPVLTAWRPSLAPVPPLQPWPPWAWTLWTL